MNSKRLLGGGVVFLVLLFPVMAFAQTLSDIINLFNTILGQLIAPLIGLAIVVFFWGVVKYVSSGADSDKAADGRRLMVYGIIAIFVMISVWGLVTILVNTLGVGGINSPPVVPQFPGGSGGGGNGGGSGFPTSIPI